VKVCANERGPAKHALAISNQKTIVSHECDGDRSHFYFFFLLLSIFLCTVVGGPEGLPKGVQK